MGQRAKEESIISLGEGQKEEQNVGWKMQDFLLCLGILDQLDLGQRESTALAASRPPLSGSPECMKCGVTDKPHLGSGSRCAPSCGFCILTLTAQLEK